MDQLGYISELYRQRTFDKPLSKVTNNILSLFVKKKGTSTYQCFKYLKTEYEKFGKTIAYKNVYKRIQKLLSYKLIEIVTNEDYEKIKHGAIYYSLTPLGIFYMFENDIVRDKTIMQEHSQDKLFLLFLYPYINSKTIQSLTDGFIMGNIITYLKKCCKRINEYYWTRIKELSKGNFTYRLSMSYTKTNYKIEDNSLRSKKFIKHLKDRLCISWINEETSKMEIITKNKKIEIKDGKKKMTMNIYIEKLEAILNDNDVNFFKFKLEKYADNSYGLGEFRSITLVGLLSSLNPAIDSGMNRSLFELCSSILEYNLWHPFDNHANQVRTENINILKQDKLFVNLVNNFKLQIEDHFEGFSKMINN